MPEYDKEGYKLLEKNFTFKGYEFDFVIDLEGGWKIYKKSKGKAVKYELIKPVRNEEYIIKGNTIPKKWSYPGDNAFGRIGFDCTSIDRCYVKHKELIASSVKVDYVKPKVTFPKTKNFTVKDVKKINPDLTTFEVRTRINELIAENKILWVNEKDYSKPQEKIYKIV